MARVMGGPLGEQLANQTPPSGLGVSDTPISCPGDFKKFERMSSSGTMSSSEELVDQEGSAGASAFEQGKGASDPSGKGRGGLDSACGPGPNLPWRQGPPVPPPDDLNGMTPELPVAVPSGPFRHLGLSKAARTHRLRKLRSPAKCRECNSYVYFHGAECEEVSGPQGWLEGPVRSTGDSWSGHLDCAFRNCPGGGGSGS